MDENTALIKKLIYDPYQMSMEDLDVEPEGREYDACQYRLNGKSILSRTAKITPKKVGQFVTCWTRDEAGGTRPYAMTDQIDYYIIHMKSGDRLGQLVLPASVLLQQGIMASTESRGKRGFRVYPRWDHPQSRQAQRTQTWQLQYFQEVRDIPNPDTIRRLYADIIGS